MANPTVRATSSGLIGTAALSASLTLPAGTQAGDLLVYLVSLSNNATGTHTPPAGFTTPAGLSTPATTGGNAGIVLTKVAAGTSGATTDAGPFTRSWTTGSSGTWVGLAIAGVSATTPIDVVRELVGSSADTSHTVPSVDPQRTAEGLLVALLAADNVGSGTSVTYSVGTSGLTQQVASTQNATSTAAAFTQALGSDAATGNKTLTASMSSRYAATSIVIAPAGTSTQRHLENTAEGSPGNDTLVTTSNSGGASGTAFDNVVGDLRFSNTPPVPMVGSWCYKASQPTSAQAKYQWTTATGTLTGYYWREYRIITALPASNILLHQARGYTQAGIDSGTPTLGNSFSARLTTTGTLQLLDSGSTVRYTSGTALPLNQLIRLEYRLVFSEMVGRMECRAFWDNGAGDHGPHSTMPTFTIGSSTDDWNLRLDSREVNAGIATATTGNTHYLDNLALSTTGWVGPAGVPSQAVAWYIVDGTGALVPAVLTAQ